MLENFGFYLNNSEIFSVENLVLISAAAFWMLIGSIQDFRKREVENWWNFSLIIFALAFRAFLSIESWNIMYFVWGLIGLAFGFVLMNAFYYARMFAGGDAKLMFALGAVIPLSLDWRVNLSLACSFIILLLLAGAVYGFIYMFIVMIQNCRKFMKAFIFELKKNQKMIMPVQILSLVFFIIFGFMNFTLGMILSGILFLSPVLIVYAKAIENSCLQRLVGINELTVGDWLVNKIKIGKTVIKPGWDGLSEEELKLLRKKYKGKVLVKYGAPFVPAFLLAFIILFYLLYYNLI